MSRVNTPILTSSDQSGLEQGHKTGVSHAFRTRCQVLLLKATGRGSKEVGEITGMSYVSVNAWVRRFKNEGLAGLKTKPGRGRKPLLSKAQDEASVLAQVKAHRQRIAQAKAEWEAEARREVSLSTFKAFLKVLTVDTSA